MIAQCLHCRREVFCRKSPAAAVERVGYVEDETPGEWLRRLADEVARSLCTCVAAKPKRAKKPWTETICKRGHWVKHGVGERPEPCTCGAPFYGEVQP